MKVRPAGSFMPLDEAMDRVREVNNHAELMALLRAEYGFWQPTESNVSIRPYCFDERNGWNTHLVCVDGNAALFADGPLL